MRISDWRSDVCSSDLAEVPANHHVARRQVADQDLDHEGLRRLQRKGTVEVQLEEVVDAGLLQRMSLGAQGGQAKGRLVRQEDRARMRLEGKDRQRCPESVGLAADRKITRLNSSPQ